MPTALPEKVETLVLGAGLAGLSTALHLGPGADALILEKLPHVGGKACTERIGEFIFDVTGHWLHLRDPGISALIERLMGLDAFYKVDRVSRIWSHGVYTEYPFQANTHGLPPAVVHECLMGAISAARARRFFLHAPGHSCTHDKILGAQPGWVREAPECLLVGRPRRFT